MADHNVQAAPGQQIIDIVLPTYRMEPEEDERYIPFTEVVGVNCDRSKKKRDGNGTLSNNIFVSLSSPFYFFVDFIHQRHKLLRIEFWQKN